MDFISDVAYDFIGSVFQLLSDTYLSSDVLYFALLCVFFGFIAKLVRNSISGS